MTDDINKALLEMRGLYHAALEQQVRMQQQLIALSRENRDLRLEAAFVRGLASIGRTPAQIEAEYQAWRTEGGYV